MKYLVENKNLKLNICKFWNRHGKTILKGNILFIQGKLNGLFVFIWKRNILQSKLEKAVGSGSLNPQTRGVCAEPGTESCDCVPPVMLLCTGLFLMEYLRNHWSPKILLLCLRTGPGWGLFKCITFTLFFPHFCLSFIMAFVLGISQHPKTAGWGTVRIKNSLWHWCSRRQVSSLHWIIALFIPLYLVFCLNE